MDDDDNNNKKIIKIIIIITIIKKLIQRSLYCYEAAVLNMEAVFSILDRNKNFFLFFGPQSLVVGPPWPLPTGVKRPRQVADRLSRHTVAVKNY
jgi:hypothetical protein